jgi:hypothetical protein
MFQSPGGLLWPREDALTGAHDRNRTGDPFLTMEVLCQLSYAGRLCLDLLTRGANRGVARHRVLRAHNGAGDGARTRDPQLGRLMLYQLSYSREVLTVLAGGKTRWWMEKDSNLRRRKPTGLQPVPFSHSGIHPRNAIQLFALSCGSDLPEEVRSAGWSWRRVSNPRPADYKSAALPTELRQPAP